LSFKRISLDVIGNSRFLLVHIHCAALQRTPYPTKRSNKKHGITRL